MVFCVIAQLSSCFVGCELFCFLEPHLNDFCTSGSNPIKSASQFFIILIYLPYTLLKTLHRFKVHGRTFTFYFWLNLKLVTDALSLFFNLHHLKLSRYRNDDMEIHT